MIRHRIISAGAIGFAILIARSACSDAYDPPSGYYSSATGTGATLKAQLNDIIDSVDDPGINDTLHTPISYDALRTALQVTDADPNNPGRMLLIYDRVSLNVAAINPGGPIPGWDNGVTWNREHVWPQSRGLDTTGSPDGSDLHHLRPSTTSVNSDRENLNFGGAFGQPFGEVTELDANNDPYTAWYPGNADAGMVARHAFYMAVRYDGTQASTTNLELGYDNVPDASGGTDPPPQMGDLDRLIQWHFAAPPDSFERRRNQIIYDDYQHNRNPFIDRPEYVWSVFMDQANNSRITINGATTDSNGGSTMNVNMGRVFRNSAMPAAPSFNLNNTGIGDDNGTDGTYFEITTTELATSTLTGRNNAFRTGVTGASGENKPITVGLNTNTSTLGQFSGTVTVNNLDVTTVGGTGRGANDADDTFNVSLTVLDHATPSFSNSSSVTSLSHDFGTITTAGVASFVFDVFNRATTPAYTANMDFDNVLSSGDTPSLTTNAGTYAGSLVLAGGAGQALSASLNSSAVGSFAATYTLRFSDENILGAQNNKDVTLSLSGTVVLAGDFNRDGVVDTADQLVWTKTNGSSATAFSGADADGSGYVDTADLAWWERNFGQVATGFGGAEQVPEPSTLLLMAIGLAAFMQRSRPIWLA